MTIHLAVILVYLAILVGIGVWASRRVSSQEDFSVAGRTLPVPVLFATLLACWIGTGSIFGNAEKTYETGIAAWILPIGELLGIAALWLLAHRVRRLEVLSVPDILEARYNATARVLGTIALVLAYTTIVSYQYRAAALVIRLAMPSLDPRLAVPVVAAFVILFTALAGMFSVAYTDVGNGTLMILGLLMAFPIFFAKAGGIDGIRAALPASHTTAFGPIGGVEAIGYLLPPFLLILGDANMYQRFFSARSERSARWAIPLFFVGVALVEFLIIGSAWAGSALLPDLPNPGAVIPAAAQAVLPPFLGAVLMAAIMAIILSTADSFLLIPSTTFVNDVWVRFFRKGASQKEIVRVSRIVVVLFGLWALFLSTLSDRFLDVALYAYTIYGAAITPAIVASFFWRRVTAAGAVASIGAGTAVTVAWKALGYEAQAPRWLGFPQGFGLDAVLPAILVSVAALVLVSLATPPSPAEKVRRFL